VTAVGGAQFRCKKIIVSIPTTLYKDITFIPNLPTDKQELVGSTFIGAYSKIVLIYRMPWWRELGLNGSFCSLDGPVCFSRDTSSEEDGYFAISCFVVGDQFRKWSRASSQQRREAIMDQLSSMIGQEHGAKVRETIEFIEQLWPREKWSEGSPCPVVGPNIWSRLAHTLIQPHGNIYFTGTETASSWRGYMEGAVQSGERGAAEVARSLRVVANL